MATYKGQRTTSNAPCWTKEEGHCKDRVLGCHSICDKYIAYDNNQKSIREARHKYHEEFTARSKKMEKKWFVAK